MFESNRSISFDKWLGNCWVASDVLTVLIACRNYIWWQMPVTTSCCTSWQPTVVFFLLTMAPWSLSVLLLDILDICYAIIAVFLYATRCSLVGRFDGSEDLCLHLQDKFLVGLCASETATNTCRTIKICDITCDKTVIITLFIQRYF